MTKLAALFAIASLALAGCEAPSKERRERWATTENTNVDINWDKVNKAYEQAEGPEDFERRVNEIYEGDELISVAVQDLEDGTQVVTGFFDKDTSGTVQDAEKIFTIRREITGEGAGQYQTSAVAKRRDAGRRAGCAATSRSLHQGPHQQGGARRHPGPSSGPAVHADRRGRRLRARHGVTS